VNGTRSTGALTSSQTYILTCQGSGGTATRSATVSVTSPAPAVTITANPTTVKNGATSLLSWKSTNATTCVASGGWSGSEPTTGTKTTAALTATTQFTLTCTGPGGTAAQSAIVTAQAPAPSVSLTANPASIANGASTTLHWTSTNATQCVATGGWTGTLATSGSQSTGALTATKTYTLSCSGAGGSATQTATVTVSGSPALGTATVSWSAPTTNTNGTPADLAGYRVYYGTQPGALTQSVKIATPATTTYKITGLTTGTWYFAVAADSVDGTQSSLSNIGSKTF
jgi:hypothetical protein